MPSTTVNIQNQTLKLFVWLGLISLLATGCTFFAEEEAPPTVELSAVEQPNVVSAEAFVVPLQDANLTFEVGGRVVTLNVEEGAVVTAGQLLAEVDNAVQKAAVAEAEAAVAEAEANLANVEAGATPTELAQAEARLARTQARLAEAIAGPTPEEIAEAQAAVEVSRAQLAQVEAPTRQEDLDASAAVLLQTEAEVREAQADYDEFVYGEPDVAEPYGIALQQATLEFERAQAQHTKLVNGATDEDIAVARAQLYQAQTTLARVRAGATAEQIAQLQADVAEATAALEDMQSGATPEEIAIAEAQVQSAEARLASVEVELSKTQLVAPFDGVIGLIDVTIGEYAQPGVRAMSVGDTGRWQIETDDLTEIDVVNVREGASVSISVDALPNAEYAGTVTRISAQSETKAGDVTYTVLIDITSGDVSKLKWGMTTFVDIDIDSNL